MRRVGGAIRAARLLVLVAQVGKLNFLLSPRFFISSRELPASKFEQMATSCTPRLLYSFCNATNRPS